MWFANLPSAGIIGLDPHRFIIDSSLQQYSITKGNKMSQNKNRTATIETNKGTIKFELYEDLAPITTGNFIELAQRNFYDGLKFHRVEPNFVIQGGCPYGTGTGGSGKNIPLEVSPNLKHGAAGAVAMARANDPNSASSQFYITLAPTPFLDRNYAVFGRVTEGMDVVGQIRVGDVMNSVTIA
jgi:peptidyl-prolyl cis-trans isomerase B (cyclophilin B)